MGLCSLVQDKQSEAVPLHSEVRQYSSPHWENHEPLTQCKALHSEGLGFSPWPLQFQKDLCWKIVGKGLLIVSG